MTNLPSRFHLTDSNAANAVLAKLNNRYPLQEEPFTERQTLYLDSFDWRIYARGMVLKLETEGAKQRLLLSDLKGFNNFESQAIECNALKFAKDLPTGRIREQIAPILEMRALLPQVEIKRSVRTLRLLNEEEKTLLKLAFEESGSRSPGKGSLNPLMSRLYLLPIRGYIKPLQRLEHFISDDLELKKIDNGELDEALAAIGRCPADYSSKLNFEFEPKMKAVDAAKQIHLHLLHIMEINLPGTRADIDSEYLHDLRVAVRRTRSALTQIKRVFPKEIVERFKEGFAWVGQVTGPTRDMDVYLLGFDDYLESLPTQFRPDLEPLHDFLRSHQKIAHQAMVKKLNSPHMHKLLKEWREFLQEPSSVQTESASNAGLAVTTLASKRIHNLYQRVIKAGQAINSHSPPEALHELRKDCKKLRYMFEFFKSLYAPKESAPFLKDLKGLLNILGDFQDLEVQAFKLREYAHQMVSEQKVPADTLLAMGMLVNNLLSRQQQAHLAFSGRFKAFASQKNRNRIKHYYFRRLRRA